MEGDDIRTTILIETHRTHLILLREKKNVFSLLKMVPIFCIIRN